MLLEIKPSSLTLTQSLLPFFKAPSPSIPSSKDATVFQSVLATSKSHFETLNESWHVKTVEKMLIKIKSQFRRDTPVEEILLMIQMGQNKVKKSILW